MTHPNAQACAYLGKRLAELRAEFDSGQRQLAMLDTRRQHLSETLLRIGGAIQVVEETMSAMNDMPIAGPATAHATAANADRNGGEG